MKDPEYRKKYSETFAAAFEHLKRSLENVVGVCWVRLFPRFMNEEDMKAECDRGVSKEIKQGFVDGNGEYVIRTAGVFVLCDGPAILKYVRFEKRYNGSLQIFDNKAASGVFLMRFAGKVSKLGTYRIDTIMHSGICVVTSEDCDIRIKFTK